MKELIKKVPLPISGLMLSIAALGNLLRPYGENLRNILGFISFTLLVLLILKAFIDKKSFVAGFNNPIIAGVMATIPMTMMILSSYLVVINRSLAVMFYMMGIVLHAIYILAFTKKYIINFSLATVFPTHFIVYVGIVCASVVAPVHQMQSLGVVIFWVGFLAYLVVLPIVTMRVVKLGFDKEIAKPSFAIYSAPASLCLAGYLNAFAETNLLLENILLLFAIGSFLIVLIKMKDLITLPFYPSFSAFTFPFVITAIAIRTLGRFTVLANFALFFAIVMVSYVFIGYLKHLKGKDLYLAKV